MSRSQPYLRRSPASPSSPFAAHYRANTVKLCLQARPALGVQTPSGRLFVTEGLAVDPAGRRSFDGYARALRPSRSSIAHINSTPSARQFAKTDTAQAPTVSAMSHVADVGAAGFSLRAGFFSLLLYAFSMTGCSAEPAPPPAAVAEGFVIGDGIQITPDLQTDAANSTAVPLQEGMARLEAAGGLDDPQQVHDTVLGMFKGVEAAETGLVVAYVLLNHFAFADGHSADDKAAWGATVAEGMQLALLHTGETLKAIAREVRVDLAYPEVTKTIPLSDGRQFLCQNMPERLGEHLVRIQGENAEAMVLHARHVRRLLDQGFGETDEERAILMTRLLASKSLIRGDLCELMDRYRSPDYEATLRASLENPLAQYMPNEPPGMLDLYQVAIRSVWQRFWDNFHLLSGYSGWGAFIGFMIAGSLLRRRRHRYERARRGALENVAGSQVQSAKEMLGMAAENGEDGDGGTQQSTDVVATQGNARATRGERRRVDTSPEGVQNAVNEMAKSVTLMGQLLHEEPPRFFSRARWRLRGESLAFYLPAVACLMLLGDGIESYQQMSERAAIPLLLPELRPVPAERIGLSYLQANDFEGYPQEVVALLDELAASMPKE